jgi:hypothetical protein
VHIAAAIAYAGRTVARPRYYANDHSRDVLDVVPVTMPVTDARGLTTTLDEAGFILVRHRSMVTDFADPGVVDAIHRHEVVEFVTGLSGADLVLVTSPGILRFSERSPRSGMLNNSHPARFAHVDVSATTAAGFARAAAPAGRPLARHAHYNVWRAISDPPQDVPLAVCDARTVATDDLIKADAVFDAPGRPEWSFEGLVVAHNPAHRWHWFPSMTRDEVIVFKTHDSDFSRAHAVPHVAFNDPSCGPQVAPRVSIEMRALALWFG